MVTELNYRIYKISGEFETLKINFEDENSKETLTEIITPDGEMRRIPQSDFYELKNIKDPSIKQAKEVRIPSECKKFDYINVKRIFEEFGNDHWHMYSYRCSQPADTWDLKIQCEDGLEIRKNIIYGDISGVFIDKSEDNKTNELPNAASGGVSITL